MKCQHVMTPDGISAIVCGERRPLKKCTCGAAAGLLCDWRLPNELTCDQPICDNCATEVGPNKHLCRHHAEAWATHPKNPDRIIRG